MLNDIKKFADNGMTIQAQLKNKFPIKDADLNNVISGGIYKVFDHNGNEIKRRDAYESVSKIGEVSELGSSIGSDNLRYFYDNIIGSSLATGYQAMLITMYAKLKGIDIVTEYPRLLDELKINGILDIKKDPNIMLQPIKYPADPAKKSPFTLDDQPIICTDCFIRVRR